MSHLNEKTFDVLAKWNFLPMRGISLKNYIHYLIGKQDAVLFLKSLWLRKSNIIDLIHSNVCSVDSKTFGGVVYFVIFMDDYSRKVWAYVLEYINFVLNVLLNFICLLKEKQEWNWNVSKQIMMVSIDVHLKILQGS